MVQLFWKEGFDVFHGEMLLTSLGFLLPLRRFDTRFSRFRRYASDSLVIAGGFWDVSTLQNLCPVHASRTRIDVQGVQGAPKRSDRNGFDPGQWGWTG